MAPPASTRIVWHGPQNSGSQTSGRSVEYFVFADPVQVEKWRTDKTIPLVDVVDRFEIYEVSNGGNTGLYEKPSKASLHNTFDTHDETAVIQRILTDGKIMRGDAPHHHEKESYDHLRAPPGNQMKGSYQGKSVSGRAAVHN